MLTMFTALEARASSYLATAEDYSIYLHIEQRILDSVQYGGASILYGGKITHNVVDALRALGYTVTYLHYEGKERMIRIDWASPKGVNNDETKHD